MAQTIGQLLIIDALPEGMQEVYAENPYLIDKKGIKQLLKEVALKYPESYADVSKKLSTLGHYASLSTGSSIKLSALRQPPEVKEQITVLKNRVRDIGDSDKPQKEKDIEIVRLVMAAMPDIQDTVYKHGLANNNPFALQAMSGSRGNETQIRQMVAGDGIVLDQSDREIGVPILNGYASGVDPVEYFAGSYGARKGTVNTKFCIAGTEEVVLSDESTKPISEVQVGDTILSLVSHNNIECTKVTAVFHNGKRRCKDYYFNRRGGKDIIRITATPDHKILTSDRGMVPLKDLEAGQGVVFADYDRDLSRVAAYSHCNSARELETFDIEVAHENHRYILKSGLVVSNSTQDAGFFGKQLTQAGHRTVVTEEDCGTSNGISVPANDKDNVGTVLANDYDGIKRGTILSSPELKQLGDKEVTVRSPITCESSRGICSKCAGVRSRGRLPDIGDNVGVLAAQAVAEKLAQDMLNAKHAGGVVGAAGPSKAGFKVTNSLVQSYSNLQDEAPLSEYDGYVTQITDAPQGGKFVHVATEKYWVPADQTITVKPGQQVEAGDVLSNGIPNPGQMVRLKGIGRGRMEFLDVFKEALDASGISTNRRNLESIAASLINHVKISSPDGFDGFMVDDVVSFNEIRRRYKPREGYESTPLNKARNKYLERPVLNYTVGTRITPRVIDSLKRHKIDQVDVHKDPPPFEPVMVRAMEGLSRDQDWQTRFLGSYLKKGFLDSVHRTSSSNLDSTSFVPGLVEGADFGDDLEDFGTY